MTLQNLLYEIGDCGGVLAVCDYAYFDGRNWYLGDQSHRLLQDNLRIDRMHCKPWGLEGGGEAAGNGIAIRHKGTWKTDLPNAKIFNVRLERGDAYKMLSGGGGGFGNPHKRDPLKVAHDAREGYVSREAAEKLYGVALDEQFGVKDAETTRLRAGTQA